MESQKNRNDKIIYSLNTVIISFVLMFQCHVQYITYFLYIPFLGEIFESKQEHCNNLLHWIDWKLMNREPHTTNFFLRSNDNARVHACENGADCLENAPLFSLIGKSLNKPY